MKKSLLITCFFPPEKGGIQNYLYHICQNLEKDKIFVLTDKKTKKQNSFKIFNYQTKRLYSYLNLSFLPILSKTWKLIKENNIKTLLLGHFFIPYALAALILKKFKNIPYIIFTHGLEILETKNSKKSDYILKLCFENAKNIIVTTDYLKEKIEKKYLDLNLSEKIIKIPPGTDYNFFKPSLNTRNLREKLHLEGKKIIFTCGRIIPRKNHQLVIRALPEVLKKVENTVYLIAGKGPEEGNLKKQVKELSLENQVKFLGQILDKDLPYYYNLADIFCMPSLYDKNTGDIEGFGIVFIESLSCETPVIGSDTGGIPNAIRHGIDGYLINPENSQELGSYITQILLNNNLAQTMGQAGREKVIREHDWKKLVKKLPC